MKMYEDIINMAYPNKDIKDDFPKSVNRAAQFAPFSALSGYEDAVKETARLTERKIELDETEKQILNSKLVYLKDNVPIEDKVSITYFVPDLKKDGGSYVTLTDDVIKVDEYKKLLIMSDGSVIPMEDIMSIESRAFNEFE